MESIVSEPLFRNRGISHCRNSPGILQAEADLDTGEVEEWRTIWNGTGGMVYPPFLIMSDRIY